VVVINFMKNDKALNNIWLSLIYLTGVIIAIYQWMFNRSFWLDEAMLANNIISRNFIELLKPLDNFTAAPPLYLWIVKLITLIAGNSEYSFRFFALICFVLAGICFFYYLQKRNNGVIFFVFAFALFMFNAFFIRYASELKQYMTDVLFSTLFLLLLNNYFNSKSKKNLILLLISGFIGILFSHAVFILIATSACLFAFDCIEKKKINKNELGVIVIWAVSISITYVLFFANHPSKQFQKAYWIDAGAFLPIWGSFADILGFFSNKINMIFFELLPFGQTLSKCFIILFVIGVVKLIKDKNWKHLLLFTLPIFIHLTLSALAMYPFEKRYLIYLIPFIILIMTEGFLYILNTISISKYSKLIVAISLVIPLLFIKKTFENKFPIKIEEVKEVITYLKKNEVKTDNLYIYYSAKPAIEYYKTTNFFNNILPTTYGSNNRNNRVGYINEFPNIKGNIWLLISHVHKNEDKYILNNLKLKGFIETKNFITKGASIYYLKSPF